MSRNRRIVVVVAVVLLGAGLTALIVSRALPAAKSAGPTNTTTTTVVPTTPATPTSVPVPTVPTLPTTTVAVTTTSTSVVVKVPTALELRFAASTIAVTGQPVDLLAILSPTAGAAATTAPTGTVSFSDRGRSLSRCRSTPIQPSGDAACSLVFAGTGLQDVTASYSGDLAHGASVSAPLHFEVLSGKVILGPSTTVDFGSLGTGRSRRRVIKVVNDTAQPLTTIDVTIAGAQAGEFEAPAPTNPGTCNSQPVPPAGGTCTLTVVFRPSVPGADTAVFTVSVPGIAGPKPLTLMGIAIPGPVAAAKEVCTLWTGPVKELVLNVKKQSGYEVGHILSTNPDAVNLSKVANILGRDPAYKKLSDAVGLLYNVPGSPSHFRSYIDGSVSYMNGACESF